MTRRNLFPDCALPLTNFSHRLYEQDSVVAEWEEFLEGIVTSRRPPPVAQHGLAVDASNFTRIYPWCTSGVGSGDDGGGGQIGPGHSPHFQTFKENRPQADPVTIEERDPLSVMDAENAYNEPGPDVVASDECGDVTRATTPRNRLPSSGTVGHGVGLETPMSTTGEDGNRRTRKTSQPLSALDHSGVAKTQGPASHVSVNVDLVDNVVEQPPELLYAIEFSVAPAQEGGEPRKLLAEVNKVVEENMARKHVPCDGVYFTCKYMTAVELQQCVHSGPNPAFAGCGRLR